MRGEEGVWNEGEEENWNIVQENIKFYWFPDIEIDKKCVFLRQKLQWPNFQSDGLGSDTCGTSAITIFSHFFVFFFTNSFVFSVFFSGFLVFSFGFMFKSSISSG